MSDLSSPFEFAPVVIHTYTRHEHLKKTIEALLLNDLAPSTDLYIASDAPRQRKDEGDVLKLREYINSIKGFKSVNIILRDKNFGLHLNASAAFDEVYKKTDRLITIEDDTIVGRGFLRYINEGLSLYRGDESVFAICGYLYKSIRINSSSDVVLLPGFSAWGYGIWRDRFYGLPNYVEVANEFLRSPKLFVKLMLNRPDLIFGVWSVASGRLVAADLAFLLDMIKKNKKCLFPKESLVRNIGNDGTGENCIVDSSYKDQQYNQNDIVIVGSDSAAHRYPLNPFFSALGGWKILIKNLSKFFMLIIVGERLYKRLANLKNSIKRMLVN
ncbi:hypothetical protein AOC19_01605 [Polynucleobacter asymbioticus]|uniref:hypothetical protein n=1 Tax=Polynucleobacter asymbioticus TaxID=576611 RepID=UPI001BFE0B74|nr:hypothetical protein [Polynucleobacter asymbioticus]QWD85601.1 hypothetical protein AOC19_01605 [Polynucleobacter asymbioticus]